MLIAHATNLTEADRTAFAHAVALSARSGARFASVHAGAAAASDLPTAEALLRRWGVEASIDEQRIVQGAGDDAAETVLEILEGLEPTLVVCSTHARTGVDRVIGGSVAEAIARNLECPTLLVPTRARPFVDPQSGRLQLERIVIPARGLLEARTALGATGLLARLAGVKDVDATLVHAEDGSPAPITEEPPGIRLARQIVAGPLEQALVSTAETLRASVIVMATRGHDTFADVVLGSHTERVLHAAACPLLWVPLPEA